MKLRQKQLAMFALCSTLVAACGRDTAKGGGADTNTTGSIKQGTTAPGGGHVSDSGVPGATSSSGDAPAGDVSGNGTGLTANSSSPPAAATTSSSNYHPPVTTTSGPSDHTPDAGTDVPDGTVPGTGSKTGIVKLKLKVK